MPYLKRENPDPEPIDCKILTAALDLFVNNGFHNISVHEIQKEAEVSIGSIYNHFGGKEGIAKALYKHIVNEMDELVNDVVEEIESPSEQCKEIIRLLFKYTETRRNIIAFVFHAKHTEFVPEELPICSSTPFTKIREIVQNGMDCGEFRKIDSWVAASSIFGGAIRMIQLRIDNHLEKPLPEYFEEIMDAAYAGLLNDTANISNETSNIAVAQ